MPECAFVLKHGMRLVCRSCSSRLADGMQNIYYLKMDQRLPAGLACCDCPKDPELSAGWPLSRAEAARLIDHFKLIDVQQFECGRTYC